MVVIDDSLYEGEESFLVVLSNAMGGRVGAGLNVTRVVILPHTPDGRCVCMCGMYCVCGVYCACVRCVCIVCVHLMFNMFLLTTALSPSRPTGVFQPIGVLGGRGVWPPGGSCVEDGHRPVPQCISDRALTDRRRSRRSVYLSDCLSVYLAVYLSVCLST